MAKDSTAEEDLDGAQPAESDSPNEWESTFGGPAEQESQSGADSPLLGPNIQESSDSEPEAPGEELAAATSFPSFPRLPPEIRLRIWELCIPQRVITVQYMAEYPPHGHRRLLLRGLLPIQGATATWIRATRTPFKIPRVLHINRESRDHALKAYRLFSGPYIPKPMYISSKNDALYFLNEESLYTFAGCIESLGDLGFSDPLHVGLSSPLRILLLQHTMFDGHENGFLCGTEGSAYYEYDVPYVDEDDVEFPPLFSGQISRWMTWFANLQEIITLQPCLLHDMEYFRSLTEDSFEKVIREKWEEHHGQGRGRKSPPKFRSIDIAEFNEMAMEPNY